MPTMGYSFMEFSMCSAKFELLLPKEQTKTKETQGTKTTILNVLVRDLSITR